MTDPTPGAPDSNNPDSNNPDSHDPDSHDKADPQAMPDKPGDHPDRDTDAGSDRLPRSPG